MHAQMLLFPETAMAYIIQIAMSLRSSNAFQPPFMVLLFHIHRYFLSTRNSILDLLSALTNFVPITTRKCL